MVHSFPTRRSSDLPHLDAISEFFTSVGIAPTLEVWSGDAGDRLGRALADRGLRAGTTTATLHATLPGRIVDRPALRPITITELGPDDNDDDYLSTLFGGYELTRARPDHLSMLRAEHDPASVRRYLAHVDGRPAAAAGLYLGPQGALLSGAATLPEFRRRGCQGA